MSDALRRLAAQLREEDTPISPHVIDPDEAAAFAPPGEHAFVIEAVREGYLLHYAEPRLLAGHDPDLALLAGDYLYALGIERLAAMGDTNAVHSPGRPDQHLRPAPHRRSRGRGASRVEGNRSKSLTPPGRKRRLSLLTVHSRTRVVVTCSSARRSRSSPGRTGRRRQGSRRGRAARH